MTEPAVTAAAPKRGLRPIFIGSKGLRAGWSVAVFVVVVIALVLGLRSGLHAIHFHAPTSDPDVMEPVSSLFQTGLQAAIMVIATLVVVMIERRPLAQTGLSLKGAPWRFVQGLAVGGMALSLLIGLLLACHAIKVGPIVLHGADLWRYGGQWALVFLLVGIAEELAFRAYLQQTLARGLNFRWACVIMGLLFAAAHGFNEGETPVSLSLGVIFAFVLSLSVWKTGTVWWAIGFHAAWDWAQSFVYGVADSGQSSVGTLIVSRPIGAAWLSGGATGPEGSVLSFVVMLAVTGVILLTLRKPDQVLDIKL